MTRLGGPFAKLLCDAIFELLDAWALLDFLMSCRAIREENHWTERLYAAKSRLQKSLEILRVSELRLKTFSGQPASYFQKLGGPDRAKYYHCMSKDRVPHGSEWLRLRVPIIDREDTDDSKTCVLSPSTSDSTTCIEQFTRLLRDSTTLCFRFEDPEGNHSNGPDGQVSLVKIIFIFEFTGLKGAVVVQAKPVPSWLEDLYHTYKQDC